MPITIKRPEDLPFVVPFNAKGPISNTDPLLILFISYPFYLSAGLAKSYVYTRVQPVADRAFTLYKWPAGVEGAAIAIGTINVPSAQVRGTYTFATAVSFAAGDAFVIGPMSAADNTISFLSGSILGTRLRNAS